MRLSSSRSASQIGMSPSLASSVVVFEDAEVLIFHDVLGSEKLTDTGVQSCEFDRRGIELVLVV